MATKILVFVLLVATLGRWLLGSRRRELARWMQRLVDTTLLVIAAALVVQLVMLAIRSTQTT